MNYLYHLADLDLERYHCDVIKGPELAMVEEHLLWCLFCACREEKLCATSGRKGAATMDHVRTDDLELYHLGCTTDDEAVTCIERHLSACRECGDRSLAIGRFIGLVRAGEIRAGAKGYECFFVKEPPSDNERK
jgi:hypothetical protein